MTSAIFTGVLFGSVSLFAFLTCRRIMIFFGCLISSLFFGILSVFTYNTDTLVLYGLLIGLLYVIIDTQIIIFKAENGTFEPYEDARHLFYDLVKIFIEILKLLSKKEKKD